MSAEWVRTLVYIAWLIGAAGFVLGLHFMNSPATARNGNRLSAAGMTIAVVATLLLLLYQGISTIGNKASGKVEDCDLTGNVLGAVVINDGAKVERRNNKE